MELRDNKGDSFKDIYFNLFGDIYRFMNKSYNLALANDWESIINEVKVIDSKYNNNEFVCDLLVSILGELENVTASKGKE